MYKFIVDNNLGKLARYLKIFGFNTLYKKEKDNDWLISIAIDTDRILLTKDTKIYNSLSKLDNIILIQHNDFKDQLKFVFNKLNLTDDDIKLFSLCIKCNVKLKQVQKESIKTLVWPYTYEKRDTFYQCPACENVYWQGTHTENVKNFIDMLLSV